MYKPVCKLVFSLNNLPYSKDRSLGFQRRLIIIPFRKTFREDDPQTKNFNELLRELMNELDGILNFALEGLARLRKNKFKFSTSTTIQEMQKEYRELINPFHQFIDEVLEQGDETDRIPNSDMISAFSAWCKDNGHSGLYKATNKKMLADIRDALFDNRIDFSIGKSGGARYTGNVRFKIKNSVTSIESDLTSILD